MKPLQQMKEFSIIGRQIVLLKPLLIGSFVTIALGEVFTIVSFSLSMPRGHLKEMFCAESPREAIAFYFCDEGDEWRLV